MQALDLAKLLEKHRYPVANEKEFQDAVEVLLTEECCNFKREYILSKADRVDFLVYDGIALELKNQGAANAVSRQLQRYAQSPEVKEIVLLTCSSKLCHMPVWLSNKRVHVAYFQGGAF